MEKRLNKHPNAYCPHERLPMLGARTHGHQPGELMVASPDKPRPPDRIS
jgi:hypothetical protein